MAAALKLVQVDQFSETVELDVERAGQNAHSLQAPFMYASPWHLTVVRHLIERFSERGDLVLDAACAAGMVGLECVERSRAFIGIESDLTLSKLAEARLSPAELPEVFLRVQTLNLKRPVDLSLYHEAFEQFFNVDTFVELVNLRSAVARNGSYADPFIKFVVASILHGHSVSHLSAYTSPNAALSPEAQRKLNGKRGEHPSYRATVPRILKKTAQLLRDGTPKSVRGGDSGLARVVAGSAGNIPEVKTGSVALALLCPHQPGAVELGSRSWLRSWWLGIESNRSEWDLSSLDEWRDHINEVLLELARVVRPGGRAVLRLGNGRWGSKSVKYAAEVTNILETCLQRFWRVEGTVLESFVDTAPHTKHSIGAPCQLLVLRRLR